MQKRVEEPFFFRTFDVEYFFFFFFFLKKKKKIVIFVGAQYT